MVDTIQILPIKVGGVHRTHTMRIPLRPEDPPYSDKDIEPPKMPNGIEVIEYVLGLSKNIHRFLEETIPLIPNIDMGLVDFREFPLSSE